MSKFVDLARSCRMRGGSIILALLCIFLSSQFIDAKTIHYSELTIEDAYDSGGMLHKFSDADGAYDCLMSNKIISRQMLACEKYFLNESGAFGISFKIYPNKEGVYSIFKKGFLDSYKIYKSINFESKLYNHKTNYEKKFFSYKVFKKLELR